MVVDLACDVALEASERLVLAELFLHPPLDVVAGAGVADHARDDDPPQSGVRLAVTAAIESVPLVLAAARIERRHAAEMGERGFAAEAFGVVARRDEQR